MFTDTCESCEGERRGEGRGGGKTRLSLSVEDAKLDPDSTQRLRSILAKERQGRQSQERQRPIRGACEYLSRFFLTTSKSAWWWYDAWPGPSEASCWTSLRTLLGGQVWILQHCLHLNSKLHWMVKQLGCEGIPVSFHFDSFHRCLVVSLDFSSTAHLRPLSSDGWHFHRWWVWCGRKQISSWTNQWESLFFLLRISDQGSDQQP